VLFVEVLESPVKVAKSSRAADRFPDCKSVPSLSSALCFLSMLYFNSSDIRVLSEVLLTAEVLTMVLLSLPKPTQESLAASYCRAARNPKS